MRPPTLALVLAAIVTACDVSPTPPIVSPAPTATPVAGGTPEPSLIRFEQVAALPGHELNGVVETSAGFVVSGCRVRLEQVYWSPCAEAVVLSSPDGRTWTQAALERPTDSAIVALAETPLGLIAIGSTTPNVAEARPARAMWRSRDGLAWQRFDVFVRESTVFTSLAVLDEALVLFGADSSDVFSVETQAWITADGAAWTEARVPSVPKVAAHPGLVALGSACVDVCPPFVAIEVHRSPDGIEWSDENRADAFAGAALDVRLESWRDRAVAAGRIDDGEDGRVDVWLDTDEGWIRSELPDSGGYWPPAFNPRAASLLLIAGAEGGAGFGGWSTSTGREWTEVAIAGLRGGYVGGLAGSDRLVAILDGRTIWLAESEGRP